MNLSGNYPQTMGVPSGRNTTKIHQNRFLKMRYSFFREKFICVSLRILKICEYLVFDGNKYILGLPKADYKVESWLSTYIRRSIAASSGIYIILKFFLNL